MPRIFPPPGDVRRDRVPRFSGRNGVGLLLRQLVELVVLLLKWSFALALVAGVGLGFYVYHRLDDEVRAAVEAQLSAKYPHLQVTVRAAQLVRGEGIRIRGLSIVEPNSSGPQEELFFVDELFVHCDTDPRVLLQGKLDVARLTLRKPILRAARRADGRWSAAQLLPFPQFGGDTPSGVIEGGVIEIVDLSGAAPAKLVLREANLKWSAASNSTPHDPNPAGRKRLRVEGRLAGDHLRNLSFEGFLDPAGSEWALSGNIGQLDVCPEFRRSLPIEPDERLDQFSGLRAKAAAQFHVRYHAAEPTGIPPADVAPRAGTYEFDVSGQFTEGRLEDARLPFPVTDLVGKFHCGNHGVVLSECTGRHGSSTLRVDVEKAGFDDHCPLRIKVAGERLTLDSRMLELLPERWRTQWHNFLPTGEVDLEAVLAFDGNAWTQEFTAQCLNVGFTYHKFPYRLEQARGKVELRDQRLTFDLTAAAAADEVRLNGDFLLAEPAAFGWVEVRADSLRVDDRMLRALPDNLQPIVRAVHPQGRFNLYWRSWKEPIDGGLLHKHVILNITDGAVRYDRFPYPLDAVRGTIEVRDDLFLFHDDLRAVNDTARITCSGQLTPSADGGELFLRFHGDAVPIDEELRDALSPGAQRLWNSMKPHGMMTFDTEVRFRLRDKSLSVWVRAEPVDDTVSIEPSYFPYRMEKLHGTLVFSDGLLQMEQLRAEHGRTQLSASGECRVDPLGGWRLQLDRLFVDRLQADRDLLNALPEALKRSTASLEPTGLFNLHGSLTLAGGADAGKPVDGEWNLAIDCHNNSIVCGVDLKAIHGSLRVTGKSAGGRFESQGELQLDSIVYNDFQFTEVLGPLWIDNEQVLLGFWADRRRGQQPERHLTGKLYGGSTVADGWVVLGDEPQYALLATLSQGDLTRFAQERLPGAGKLSGEILATVDVRGKGRGRNNLTGRGSIQLRNADIYEVPAMVQLLKVLSLQAPDKRGFSESDINFVLQGEHCYLERIDLDGKAISLQGRGEVNLATDALALVFRAVVGSDARKMPGIKQLMGGASQQILLIHVDGTLRDPQIRNEAFPGVNQVLEQLQAELQRPLTPQVPTGGTPAPAGPRYPF